MTKRKNLRDTLFDLLEDLAPVYVGLLLIFWFADKANFWKWAIGGVVVVAVIVTIIVVWEEYRFKHVKGFLSDRQLLKKLRGMKPAEFEEYIADLFTKLGYKTEAVGGSYDGGIDVVAEKNEVKHYIQCKKYIKSTVGVKEVREFYGAIADHLANAKAFFITTNKFTLEAERYAEDKPIELIDGYKLVDYIRQTEKGNDKKESNICPKCGGELVKKTGKYGPFLGCSNYPKCKYTENI